MTLASLKAGGALVRGRPGRAYFITHERGPDGPVYVIRDADADDRAVAWRPFLTLAILAADALARGESIDKGA